MLALAGKIVTFEPKTPVVDPGVLYVADDGRIEAVTGRNDAVPAAFESVEPIDVEGVLYPGLIDLHSHLLYNLRSLWVPKHPEHPAPFVSHEQWPGFGDYGAEITGPAKIWSKSTAAKEVLAFAEVKAIVGGTTAIQGAPGTSSPYEGFLIRNVDNETFGTGEDKVSQSALTLPPETLPARAELMRHGSAFVYHLAEGTSPKLLKEFNDVAGADCLAERLVAIHATALGDAEFEAWSVRAGSIVWSPFSNLWLYRDTTRVDNAAAKGLRICLGSDWGPSGSKNVLGELKVADLWNREHLGSAFTDLQLCEMVTSNPADALGPMWSERVGRLTAGRLADVLVLDDRNDDGYRNLIESTERDVRLVLVGGKARYGRSALMAAAGAEAAEPIPQAGTGRRISLAGGRTPLSWQSVLAALEAVIADPQGAIERTSRARALGEEPFELEPDMPERPFELIADLREEPAPRAVDLSTVTIPPLDTFRHDTAFFDQLGRDKAPILDGLLDELRTYYRNGA